MEDTLQSIIDTVINLSNDTATIFFNTPVKIVISLYLSFALYSVVSDFGGGLLPVLSNCSRKYS